MEEQLKKGGKVCAVIKRKLPEHVKPGESILEAAEWLESRIRNAGAEPAFPVNICIDDVAAHFTPPPGYGGSFQEGQLVKVDFGVHVDGWPVDNALTIDLGDHADLLQASRDGLAAGKEALMDRGPEATLSELGRAIEGAIRARGFSPIVNLTGHSMDRWLLHGGLSIHNYDSGSSKELGEGLFALEPFATTGQGRVKNGPDSEIYRLLDDKPQRLPQARKLMEEVRKFRTLPFCSRWVSRPRFLRLLVRSKALHNYPLLVEVSGGKVSQAENSFLVAEEGVEQLT